MKSLLKAAFALLTIRQSNPVRVHSVSGALPLRYKSGLPALLVLLCVQHAGAASVSYDDLSKDYDRQIIDHLESYVKGNVHTNGLENFWSLLKRCLKGTYVNVEPFSSVPILR
ncbi:MAG TPA: transposase [Chthoniobacterales bacterium]